MIDRFLRNLYERVNLDSIEAEDIDYLIREQKFNKHTKVIPINILQLHANEILEQLSREEFEKQEQEKQLKPYKKFLFVEDGSVDADNLIGELKCKNPEIKIVIYRAGSNKPEFLELQ